MATSISRILHSKTHRHSYKNAAIVVEVGPLTLETQADQQIDVSDTLRGLCESASALSPITLDLLGNFQLR